MKYKNTLGRTLFDTGNYAFLAILSIICFIPLWNVLAISFSSSSATDAGLVTFWPIHFTLEAYTFVTNTPEFIRSLGYTFYREFTGVPLSMLMSVLIAYPLSKETSEFKVRTVYVWIFVFSMLFHGGLIPTYILILELGLMNTMGALVIPTAVNVFNVILLLNFFRAIPKELMDAAHIDGAGHGRTLWSIVLPVSLPALATITLFTTVFHWNAWFDGIIYMNNPSRYPLSSYLQTVIIGQDMSRLNATEIAEIQNLSQRNVRAAQIFLGALPILMVYPFLQRYFMTGIVMGSVKE